MTVSDLSIIKSNKFFIGKVTEDQKDIWELKKPIYVGGGRAIQHRSNSYTRRKRNYNTGFC